VHILLIEDEDQLSAEILDFLRKEGYSCDHAGNGKEARDKLIFNQYEFVLLDLNLPDGDGLKLLQQHKDQRSGTAFIIITARGQVEDRVRGLDLGADDYLPKPFSLLELKARMLAITRRKYNMTDNVFQLHDIELNLDTRMVSVNGSAISLTRKEFDLLYYLMINRNRVLTRFQMLEHVWGNDLASDLDSNYIDVHIKNLRKKLSAHTSIDWLETVRGVGYKVNA
jgi:DNA-binding response OmpR family regulator